MRFRRRNSNKSIIKEAPSIITDPKQYKGKWSSLFLNKNKIHLEIGMGKGDFILTKAIKYPHLNFIGLEKNESIMAQALKKIGPHNINNLKLIIGDANDINNFFAEEITSLYLNFPDPWPKLKHFKRRLVNDIFLKKYHLLFKGNHKIYLKTDSKALFDYTIKELNKNHYLLKVINYKLLNDNIVTEYETKFLALKKKIYCLEAFKEKG